MYNKQLRSIQFQWSYKLAAAHKLKEKNQFYVFFWSRIRIRRKDKITSQYPLTSHQNISHKLHHIATLVLCAAENIRPHKWKIACVWLFVPLAFHFLLFEVLQQYKNTCVNSTTKLIETGMYCKIIKMRNGINISRKWLVHN